MSELYRQGDVLIKRVEPQHRTFRTLNNYILAYGEVTGHKHEIVIDQGILEVSENDGQVFIRIVGETAIVKHEEHHQIVLSPGDYQVIIQEEYSPSGYRKVQD